MDYNNKHIQENLHIENSFSLIYNNKNQFKNDGVFTLFAYFQVFNDILFDKNEYNIYKTENSNHFIISVKSDKIYKDEYICLFQKIYYSNNKIEKEIELKNYIKSMVEKFYLNKNTKVKNINNKKINKI